MERTSFVVVHTEHQFPPATALGHRERWRWQQARADVLLRVAEQGWTDTDADHWIHDQYPAGLADPAIVAVVFGDRCVLRLRSGVRIVATLDGGGHHVHACSMIPAVVADAVCRARSTQVDAVPETLTLRALGQAHSPQRHRFRCAATAEVASDSR